MALTEKNIRNILIYAAPRFISYGVNLLVLPLLTRLLTPREFGVVALVWLFPTIATGVFTCGLTSSAQRYYFEYRHDRHKFLAFTFSLQLFLYGSLLISALGVFFLKDEISFLSMGNKNFGTAILATYITAYLGQIISFYLGLYQNMERAGTNFIFTVSQSVISSVSGLGLVWYFKLSYMGILYGSLLGGTIICLALLYHFNKGAQGIFDRQILEENIKYGLQVVPKTFTSFISRFFDKYMLNNMCSLSAVGVYNIGQTVGNLIFTLTNAVWSSFQPVYYREVFDNGVSGAGTVGRLFTIFSYINLFPILLLVVFAQELVTVIAPKSYYAAIDVIIIIAASNITQIFGIYCGVQYAYSKKAYWLPAITVVNVLLNVGANILLIPKYGLTGAALSMVISISLTNVLLVIIGQKLYKIIYEWDRIFFLYGTVALAACMILYFRSIKLSGIVVYLTKAGLIALFLYWGLHAKIITQNAWAKLKSSLNF